MGISATVISFNEEKNIERCLESVVWADEIILVDSHSTDRTVELAKKYTNNIILHEWEGYVAQKNFVLNLVSQEWAIHLDADESLSNELQETIKQLINENNDISAYAFKRHTYYMGQWINHCGWYPDWKVRLTKKGKARWKGKDPHDELTLLDQHDKSEKIAKGDILHYNYDSFSEHIQTIDRFSTIVIGYDNSKPSLLSTIFHPFCKFLEVYIYKKGFMDGLPGFIISTASSFYVFAKYAKRWEKFINGKRSAN
ncbi:MAG: glycosyltransferase family 2 protein [Planctomycetes bacterium]|nr:glycosyltransferase family 2 protein [Planctomycetota bacterium]